MVKENVVSKLEEKFGKGVTKTCAASIMWNEGGMKGSVL